MSFQQTRLTTVFETTETICHRLRPALVVVAYAARNSGTAATGLIVGELISIELILFLSGLMSGLSGFGFSARETLSLS